MVVGGVLFFTFVGFEDTIVEETPMSVKAASPFVAGRIRGGGDTVPSLFRFNRARRSCSKDIAIARLRSSSSLAPGDAVASES